MEPLAINKEQLITKSSTIAIAETKKEEQVVTSYTFTDISEYADAHYIERAAQLAILKGYSDNTFQPSKDLTRAQAASIISRLLGLQTEAKAPFIDIQNYDLETQRNIAAAYEHGIIKGYNNKFRPAAKITRVQFSLMLYRTYTNVLEKEYQIIRLANFSDIKEYDLEAQRAVTLLFDQEIIQGLNGLFHPSNPTKRVHAAKMIVNYSEMKSDSEIIAIN